MNYATIKNCDIANGPGVRVSLFVSGCTHHCKGCFQPETWDFGYGEEYTPEVEQRIIDSLRPKYVTGLTVLGGEPFEPSNQRTLVGLLERVRNELPEKTVWVYSGYTWEELTGRSQSRCRCEVTDTMLSMIDILVDGEFVESKKSLTLMFRGSSNQRIIDVRKSLMEGNGPMIWTGLNDRGTIVYKARSRHSVRTFIKSFKT